MTLNLVLVSHLFLMVMLIVIGSLMKKPDATGDWSLLANVFLGVAVLCAGAAVGISYKSLHVPETAAADALPSPGEFFNRVLLLATVSEIGPLLGAVVAVTEGNLTAQLLITAVAAIPFIACFFPMSKRYFDLQARLAGSGD